MEKRAGKRWLYCEEAEILVTAIVGMIGILSDDPCD